MKIDVKNVYEVRESEYWDQVRGCFLAPGSHFHLLLGNLQDRIYWYGPRNRILIAHRSNQVLAIADTAEFGWISIYVKPEFRRKGIGTRMYRAAVRECKKQGWSSILVGDRHDEPSTGFYDSVENHVQVNNFTSVG